MLWRANLLWNADVWRILAAIAPGVSHQICGGTIYQFMGWVVSTHLLDLYPENVENIQSVSDSWAVGRLMACDFHFLESCFMISIFMACLKLRCDCLGTLRGLKLMTSCSLKPETQKMHQHLPTPTVASFHAEETIHKMVHQWPLDSPWTRYASPQHKPH